MSAPRDWSKARHNPKGYEDAAPRKEEAKRGGSHVKPSEVKRWADMTPAERAAILKTLKRP